MKGWILYKRSQDELTENDHGVNRLLSAAANLRIKLSVFKPTQFDLIATNDIHTSVLLEGKSPQLPDFIIPRTGAESTPFTLALIRQLELLGVYSANKSGAIEVVRDKMRVSQLLTANNLPTPKTMLLNFPVAFNIVKQQIGFPLVIKNIAGARGIGVHLCETASSFNDLMGLFNAQLTTQLIVQEFIGSSHGRDLRVFVLGGEVIGCMVRTAKDGFKANYSLGGEVKLFPITDEIEQLAVKCTELVGLEIAGIDLLFDAKGGFVICEANSSPGFKGMESATGKNVADQILNYIGSQVKNR